MKAFVGISMTLTELSLRRHSGHVATAARLKWKISVSLAVVAQKRGLYPFKKCVLLQMAS
jgi:hypothetical protein